MERITYIYQGKEYTGELIRSENISPSYYWMTVEHPELKNELGDDIGFRIDGERLVPASKNWSDRHQEILDSIKTAIQSFI